MGAASIVAAEDVGEHLAAEAEPEDRDVVLDGACDQLDLGGCTCGTSGVGGRVAAAEAGDGVERRARPACGSCALSLTTYVDAARVEPLAEQRGRAGLSVLADEDHAGTASSSSRRPRRRAGGGSASAGAAR